MRIRTGTILPATVAVSVAALIAVACSSNSNNGGTTSPGDVANFQQDFSFALENNLSGFGDAMNRMIGAAHGTTESGVTTTAITNGVQASVGVDVDGDGHFETTLNGTLVYLNPGQGLPGGATLTITSITGGAPQTASGAGVITQTGPAILTLSNGHFSTQTETQHHSLSITQANLTLDATEASPAVTGTAHFTFDGISGTMTFQTTATGFKVQVSGSGFTTFTVPCATEICS
ncbi:MAG: hypothetical protein ACREK8_01900 [Gemmatimonadales bacterium]